ncbi:TfuA-like protein [Streptomyces sp. NPDC059070]|uniref:TfuA-like protein n=1 Tax=Streptomyces sp. NPDC059070 TaxID=3346713 RepID=UPI0036871678
MSETAMTQLHLFLGPTLPDVTGLPGIRILPPVAAEDLLRLPLREGDVVGIVDGYFHQQRPVRHKEILAVMARGVRVLGSSSMGALRAAELDAYGMRGVGDVYEDYRSGRIDADDEVALRHGPPESGYRAMSEPLVNMRATLAAAVREGVCDGAGAQLIVKALAAVPYARRDYRMLPELADRVGMSRQDLAGLGAYCARHAVDVKRADALRLIDLMREPAPTLPRPQVNRTTHLVTWELAARRPHRPGDTAASASGPGDLEALRVLQLFAADYPALLRRERLRWIARECAGSCGPSAAAEDPAATALAHGVHRGVYRLDGDRPGDLGFLDRWLAPDELTRSTRQEKLERFLTRSFRTAPGVLPDGPLLDRFQQTPGFAYAAEIAQASYEVEVERTRRDPAYSCAQLSPAPIMRLLTGLWGSTEADADFHALDRGFDSLRDAAEAARPFYLLVACGPDLAKLCELERPGPTAQLP